MIDVSANDEDCETDKNETQHNKQPKENNVYREKDEPYIENSENNVDIKNITEGQKDNINMTKDSVVDEDEDQSASHVLKAEDIQLIENPDEKDDAKDDGFSPNLSGFHKKHGTSLPNDSERKIDKNETGDKMHAVPTTNDSNGLVKAKHSSVQSQHISDAYSNSSQRNDQFIMNQNQSIDNRQTTSSPNANTEPFQKISGSVAKKCELSEKDWHSTACCLDVTFCILFIVAFCVSYWAILGQLFAKNHNIM